MRALGVLLLGAVVGIGLIAPGWWNHRKAVRHADELIADALAETDPNYGAALTRDGKVFNVAKRKVIRLASGTMLLDPRSSPRSADVFFVEGGVWVSDGAQLIAAIDAFLDDPEAEATDLASFTRTVIDRMEREGRREQARARHTTARQAGGTYNGDTPGLLRNGFAAAGTAARAVAAAKKVERANEALDELHEMKIRGIRERDAPAGLLALRRFHEHRKNNQPLNFSYLLNQRELVEQFIKDLGDEVEGSAGRVDPTAFKRAANLWNRELGIARASVERPAPGSDEHAAAVAALAPAAPHDPGLMAELMKRHLRYLTRSESSASRRLIAEARYLTSFGDEIPNARERLRQIDARLRELLALPIDNDLETSRDVLDTAVDLAASRYGLRANRREHLRIVGVIAHRMHRHLAAFHAARVPRHDKADPAPEFRASLRQVELELEKASLAFAGRKLIAPMAARSRRAGARWADWFLNIDHDSPPASPLTWEGDPAPAPLADAVAR